MRCRPDGRRWDFLSVPASGHGRQYCLWNRRNISKTAAARAARNLSMRLPEVLRQPGSSGKFQAPNQSSFLVL